MALKFLTNNVFDFLKPAYYKLEKSVAAKSIPPVHEITGRKKLADYPVPTSNVMDHALWDALLKQYVNTDASNTIGAVSGIHLVDYQGLQGNPDFAKYLESLATADPTALPEAEQIAFWMNAYNAICISLLINYMKDQPKDAPPLQSINELSKPDQPVVWDLPAGTVAGQTVSLNQIEHDQLRKVWDEPAVHGCIVCASASCPNLRPEAFVGTTVRQQMDDQVRQWMKNDTKGLHFSPQHSHKLQLSRIFLWFADDFGGWEGLRQWLPQYLEDETLKERLAQDKVKVRFFEYSWKMNKQQ